MKSVRGDLLAALRRSKKAVTAFEVMSRSHQKRWVEYVAEAAGRTHRAPKWATGSGRAHRRMRSRGPTILYRVHDAKRPDTRARRVAKYVAMCARGETIH